MADKTGVPGFFRMSANGGMGSGNNTAWAVSFVEMRARSSASVRIPSSWFAVDPKSGKIELAEVIPPGPLGRECRRLEARVRHSQRWRRSCSQQAGCDGEPSVAAV